MSCSNCNSNLPKEGDFVTCKHCDGNYHFGDCAGLSKSTWKAKSTHKRNDWKCSKCRKNGNNTKDDTNQQYPNDPNFQALKTMLEKMFANAEKNITDRIDKLSNIISDVQTQLKAITNQVKEIESTTTTLQAEINSLKVTVESEKQYNRSKNFIISGIPVQKNENIKTEVCKLMTAMRIDIKQEELTVHRLPSKTEEQPIIVQCYSRGTRDLMVRTARKYRPSLALLSPTAKDKDRPIYFNDHLTPYFGTLMIKAKALKIEKNFKFVWLDGNKIMMKKDENTRAFKISCDEDFDRIK